MSVLNVSVVSIEAADRSAVPLLRFKVKVPYKQYSRIILQVAGELFTASGIFLSKLEETEFPTSAEQLLNARMPSDKEEQAEYVVSLTAQLNDSSLKAIEKERDAEPKHDTRLKLELYVTALDSAAVVSNLHLKKPPRSAYFKDLYALVPDKFQDGLELPLYYLDPDLRRDLIDSWFISGESGPALLKLGKYKTDTGYTIPASDWIHDFKPRMNLGKYIVIELPQPMEPARGGKCYEHLQRAKVAFDQWDIKGVFYECRELGKCLDVLIKEIGGDKSFLYNVRWERAHLRFAEGDKNWASMALHEVDLGKTYGDNVKFTRADAEALLLSAEVLFKYAMELLNEAGTQNPVAPEGP